MTREREHNAILVVDDDDQIRKLLSTVMRREGYSVDTAADGEAALELIAERAYGAVLLDLMMPVRSGYEVLHEIEERGEKECVIIISAVAQESLGRIRGQVAAVVAKPFDFQSIVGTVRSCIAETWDGDDPEESL
jgi:DNA-binding response OmpR family regulator